MHQLLVRFVILAVMVCSYLFAAPCRGEEASKPNVLFLICDDLNCDLGCYGHPMVKSPNIDKLAARGVRFEHAYCQFPLCGPSRASFMTGLYPDQTLIHSNSILIRQHLPDVQTMSQMFRKNGYTATRIGKIYHYGVPRFIGTPGHDDPASWDHTINPRGRDKTDEALVKTLREGQYGGTLSWLAADGTDEEQTDGIAATEAVKLLKDYARDDTAFFLAVGLYRPHTPFVAPKKYFAMYPPEDIVVPTVPKGHHDALPGPAKASITRKKEQLNLKTELAQEIIGAYYASISLADAQIGRILDALEETGLAENTIVVFTSDHGYHMGEHGHYQKTTLFENAARVPLIIATPDMKTAGKATTSPAEMIDFYPTLAELTGLNPPENLSGVSLTTTLRDVDVASRDAALTQYGGGYSLRTPRYRYTEWGKDGTNGNELYDHTTDPKEMSNLANSAEYVETVAELSKQLRRRIADAQSVPEGLKQIGRKGGRRK